MAAIKPTRAFCDALKPQGGRQVSFPDSDVRGLELRVSGDARKAWTYRYRTLLGRQARLSLGTYSDVFGVAQARAAARRVRLSVDEGADPASLKRDARLEASLEHLKTFGDLADAAAGRRRALGDVGTTDSSAPLDGAAGEVAATMRGGRPRPALAAGGPEGAVALPLPRGLRAARHADTSLSRQPTRPGEITTGRGKPPLF